MPVNRMLLTAQIVGMFVVFALVLFLAWLAIMPLDSMRFRWSRMPGWLQVLGALLLGPGKAGIMELIIPIKRSSFDER